MSPNMGQGACQAIEDSYVLSECLNKYTTEKAFLKYQELRIEKATGLVNLSWRLGKMAHITNPFLIKIIRLIFRLTPSYFQRLQLDKIYKLASV